MDGNQQDNLQQSTMAPAGGGFAPPSSGPPLQASVPDYNAPQQAGTPPTSQAPQPHSTSIGPAPDEVEMDKAWVDRAVVILDQTREDPFIQSQEVAKLRAQYMQARFDKQIKIAQEQQQ